MWKSKAERARQTAVLKRIYNQPLRALWIAGCGCARCRAFEKS